MILWRSVFQAKINKADELVAALKEATSSMPNEQKNALKPRILTDISGRFFTVVLETTHESLAALEQFRQELFSQAQSQASTFDMFSIVESGQNEYYTIEM